MSLAPGTVLKERLMKSLDDSIEYDPSRPGGEHIQRDQEKLRYHRRVAEMLEQDPVRCLRTARDNLSRWLAKDRDSKPYYEEWEVILAERSVSEIVAILVEDSAEGRRLRQSSPFVGLMPQAERDRYFARA
jgi:hypothetical protein